MLVAETKTPLDVSGDDIMFESEIQLKMHSTVDEALGATCNKLERLLSSYQEELKTTEIESFFNRTFRDSNILEQLTAMYVPVYKSADAPMVEWLTGSLQTGDHTGKSAISRDDLELSTIAAVDRLQLLEHRLHEYTQQFQSRLCNILIVCKGTKEGGNKWRKLTGITFSVLADEYHEFVSRLQFDQSVYATLNAEKLHARAKQMADGKAVFKAFVDDPLHDFYQQGGDVLIDHKGKVLYVHRSSAKDDRPEPADIIAMIPTIDSKGRPISAATASTAATDSETTEVVLFLHFVSDSIRGM